MTESKQEKKKKKKEIAYPPSQPFQGYCES